MGTSGSICGNSQVPRFDTDSVNSALASTPGEGFQDFTFELLRRKYKELRTYPTLGKDGGIDLIEEGALGRHVFECKYIGADGLGPARSRWRDVARNLTKHLPNQAPRQYSPWWATEPPIVSYAFCVSSVLGNQDQVDTLKDEIRQVLRTLSESHAHLGHLRDVDVQVLHWPDLDAEVTGVPDLLFRWFPQTRPLGLVPIDDSPPRGPFSSFLDSSKLGYYSRRQHIANYGIPPGIEIETEAAMLERLSQTVGLIITGAGGHGKTRLVQELGWLAAHQGWCALRVSGSWRSKSLERLGELVPQSARVLLLVDYVETQKGFADMVSDLVDINDTYGLEIRYIANCRSSFYPRVAHLSQHDEVPLAPMNGVEWFRDFRHAVVRHILTAGDVGVNSRTLQVCRDIPVIAVFLAYLSVTNRTDDLRELLNERDFAKWVHGRVRRSFPRTETRDVAAMIAQFPMPEKAALELAPDEVLSTLERDGWIERQTIIDGGNGAREWAVVHDVLADQLLTSSLAEQGAFAAAAVRELLSAALANGTLVSMLSSLQRIQDNLAVEDIPLSAIVRDQFAVEPQEWVTQAPNFLGSSLLDPLDAVTVLEQGKDAWIAQLQARGFRQQVGWLARQKPVLDSDTTRVGVLAWLQQALDIEETDYLLRSGLIASPSTTASRARAWIDARPTDFATHFVITAWLTAGLPSVAISESVRAWLQTHGEHPRAWHVLGGWLSGGGDPALVESFVLRWLNVHHSGMRFGAMVVLHTWLKSGGSVAVVERFVVAWLSLNISQPNSSYVLSSWLEREAELDVVQPLIEQWLAHHCEASDAGFVMAAWLNQGGSLDLVMKDVETWLDEHGDEPEGPMMLSALVRASPKTPQLIDSVSKRWSDPAATGYGAVLSGWLAGDGSAQLIQPQLDNWLSEFGEEREAGSVYSAWLAQADAPSHVRKASLRWFRSFSADIQAGYLSKLYVQEDVLDAETVRAVLGWCVSFPTHEDALWRLTQLRTNLWLEEVSEEALATVETVSEAALAETELAPTTGTQLTTLCSFIAQGRAFQNGIAADRCDAVLVSWLRHPRSFQHGGVQLINAERPSFLRRMLSLLLREWIDVKADAPALARMLTWVASWEDIYHPETQQIVHQMATMYPDAEHLWGLVRPLPS